VLAFLGILVYLRLLVDIIAPFAHVLLIAAFGLGFELWGVIGALFAVPTARLLWVLFSTAVRAWRDKRIQLRRWTRPTRRIRARAS